MELQLSRIPSPLSELLVVTDDQGLLRALDFDDCAPRMHRLLAQHYGAVTLRHGRVPGALREPLDAYFAGNLDACREIPTATAGSAFQERVWQALRAIAPGQTCSYGALAETLGNANASRAVGLANGQNPIAIVVPCHRVIGKSGALTGYAGGLARKRWLLAHEQTTLARTASMPA